MGTRKSVDCRDVKGSNCSLKISGSEEEVIRAGAEHAVSAHGQQNTPELKEYIRKAMKVEAEESVPFPRQKDSQQDQSINQGYI